MADFLRTEAVQHAAIAKQYLEGALTLDAAARERGPILFRPTLALAGHGLELMLKACMYWNDEAPQKSGREGHNVESLWKELKCKPVRDHVLYNAYRVADDDRKSEVFSSVPEQHEVEGLIEEYVVALGRLHGQRDFPLRYPSSDPNQTAPRSHLLVQSLWAAVDDFVKRPNEFKRGATPN